MSHNRQSVFVSEYICGGALAGQELPSSLAAEGGAMLAAVVEDLADLPRVEVTTTLDRRLIVASEQVGKDNEIPTRQLVNSLTRQSVRVVEISDAADEIACFHRLVRECDATLVIAPEFDRILFDRTRWVEQAGGRLLGSSSQAIDVASDKYRTNRLLAERGVPATKGVCWQLGEWASGRVGAHELRVDGLKSAIGPSFPDPRPPTPDPPPLPQFPAVLKPRFGAGSQCTYLIERASDVPQILEQAVREGIGEHALLETYVAGQPASVAVLVADDGATALPVCSQRLSDNGGFRYLGGSLPVLGPQARRAQEVAVRAVGCIPALWGYVGVDLVLHADGTGVTVVEINPRLTTSYVGLRAALEENLMAVLVGEVHGRFRGPKRIRRISFRSDGQVSAE